MANGNPVTDEWYYRKHAGDRYFEFGPFTWEKLFVLYMKGEINGDTEVRGVPFPWCPLKAFLPGSKFNLKIQMARVSYLARCSFHDLINHSRRENKLMAIAICLVIVYLIVHYVIFPMPRPERISREASASQGTRRPFEPRPSAAAGIHPLQEELTSSEVLRLTNITRSENGVHELKESFLLNAVAVDRAKDMLEKQYFDHVSPTGEKASDIAQKVGYRYKNLGENIAAGSFLNNQKIINGWMQSPGHRRSLLSKDFEEIGIAVVKGRMGGDETWIAVQVFGRQSPPVGEAK